MRCSNRQFTVRHPGAVAPSSGRHAGGQASESLETIRQRAAAHQRELEEPEFATVREVAARWRLSTTYVRDVPRSALPYTEFGHGLKLKRRRYRWSDVEAYERAEYERQNDARAGGRALT